MKVFVSSTTAGLGSYRRAVVNQLQALGVEPIHQQDGRLDFGTIRTILKRRILMCDAVICLIGPAFGAAPDQPGVNPPRSYTQLEYDMARDLKKQIFILLSSPRCKLDKFTEDDPRPAWQQRFIQELGDNRYETFKDAGELQDQICRFASAVSAIARGSSLAHVVAEEYPTLLAEYFRKHRETLGLDLGSLTKVLSFLSLLVARDAQQCGEVDFTTEDFKAQSASDCCALLSRCSRAHRSKHQHRFIPALADWYEMHGEELADMIQELRTFSDLNESGDLSDAERAVHEENQRANLELLYDWMKFLRDYAVAAVDGSGLQGKATIEVYRGDQAQTAAVSLAPDRQFPFQGGGVYLLALTGQRRALPLWPMFWRLPGKLNSLFGWRARDRADLRLTTFGDGGPVTIAFEEPAGRGAADSEALLSEESWQQIMELALPLYRRERLLVSGYELVGGPFYHGAVADIYLALPQTQDGKEPVPGTGDCAVHVPRKDALNDPAMRTRIADRAGMWRLLQHPNVLTPRIMEVSVTCEQPFLAVDHVDTRCSMMDRTQVEGPMPVERLIEVMRIASGICQDAHSKELCVLSLPLRHILIDHAGRLRFTGFDTLWRRGAVLPPREILYRLFKKDHGSFAFEIREGRQVADVRADIYALGELLRQLRSGGTPDRGDQRFRRGAAAGSDPWDWILFHCLAHDPSVRFRTAEHFSQFLEKWCAEGREPLPETVPLCGALPSSLRIGKYPVTNIEFEYFCRQENKGRCLPLTLSCERLQGPFLPVVGVNLIEATAYCDWLSRTTGYRWRLPYEKEWILAAGGPGHDLRPDQGPVYPWGAGFAEGCANAGHRYPGPTVVGGFALGRSPSGCYDMGGNGWEWCLDRIPGAPLRVLKGGSYQSSMEELDVRSRRGVVVAYRSEDTGFRVVCEVSS